MLATFQTKSLEFMRLMKTKFLSCKRKKLGKKMELCIKQSQVGRGRKREMFVSLCQWLKFCAFYVIVNFSLDLLNIERGKRNMRSQKRRELRGKTSRASYSLFLLLFTMVSKNHHNIKILLSSNKNHALHTKLERSVIFHENLDVKE